ncbi:MAG: type I restriction enzyme HsdR N-terminal domain-containing protein [Chloroflexi bacterium]|nr:type I restriction enzyme HsdR N-terminal domain-containing protein [Chloroflexota bacterium]
MSLYDELAKIAQDVEHQREQMKYEAGTVVVSVQQFIRALGYNLHNLSEVYPEYVADPRESGGEAVDYAILRDGSPIIIIEAKAAVHTLNEQHWRQLHDYFVALDVQFAVLTNGIEYRFYTDSVRQHVLDKKPFLTINLRTLDRSSVQVLEHFSKSQFTPEQGMRKLRVRLLLEDELKRPSDEFVRLFAKRVHSGPIWKEVIAEFRPIVQQSLHDLVGQGIKPPPSPPDPPPPTNDIPVFGYHEGHRFKAELLRSTMDRGLQIARHHIRYNGETTWLKNAAVMAIRSVVPNFKPTRTYPNGFTFWYVVDPADGKEHMIRYISGWDMTDEALRQRVLNKS